MHLLLIIYIRMAPGLHSLSNVEYMHAGDRSKLTNFSNQF